MDEAFYAVFQQRNIEVHQQADVVAGKFQVGKELRLVNRGQLLDRLKLHYHRVFNQEIDPKAAAQVAALVDDRQLDLRGKAQAASSIGRRVALVLDAVL